MQHQPLLLHIETATEVCSTCLSKGSTIVALKEIDTPFQHASQLTLLIEACFKDSSHKIPELEGIVVSNGPGSYTGLRIGLSTAKGLCFALNIPLIQVSTLQSLAAGLLSHIKDLGDVRLVPMIDARRMEVYTAVYNTALSELSPPQAWVIEPELFLPIQNEMTVLFGGNGSQKATSLLAGNHFLFCDVKCSAIHLVDIGLNRYFSEGFENIAYSKPFYLKAPNVTKPRIKT